MAVASITLIVLVSLGGVFAAGVGREVAHGLTRAGAVALAERIGLTSILWGTVGGRRDHLVMRGTLVDVGSGDPQTSARVSGPEAELPQLVDRLASKLLVQLVGE
jgi:hypothetical protein